MYVVKDNSTESQANIASVKAFLTQDEFWALVAANAQGDPGTAIQGDLDLTCCWIYVSFIC